MENKIIQKSKIKKAAYILIVFVCIAAITLTLIKNKSKIDKAAKVTDRSAIPVAVNTATVKNGDMNISNQYPATVKAFDEANISSQISGQISHLNIELGQKVKAGEVLGSVDTSILSLNLQANEINLQTAKNNKDIAEINVQKLKQDYERAKYLYEHNAAQEINMINSKNAYDNATASLENATTGYNAVLTQISLTKQQIANSRIISPLNGTISSKNIKPGEFAAAGAIIATVTDVNTLKTTAYVEQATAYTLRLGQNAFITSPVFGNDQLTGKIIFINPKADANHNFQVDLLVVQNPAGIPLKAGTDAQVSFNIINKKSVLIIPKAALVTDREEPFVYVIEDGKAKGKEIQIGSVINDKVEVLSGLQENEQVVTSGQINLHEGSKVSVIK